MIAFRRADVADLNGRARALTSAAGRLGSVRLRAGDREFAAGDRVIVRRNDRRLQVANGERGTVAEVDPGDGSLVVQLGDRQVRLDCRYLRCPGSLSHGYAVTGHVAQGMTADRAFVLGTSTLFREWGYVAMSRGRHENRFYAVVGEPSERDEIAPREGKRPPLEELQAALERSRAQRLASEDQPQAAAIAPMPLRRAATSADLRRRAWFAHAATTLDPPERIVNVLGPRPERPSDLERWRAKARDPAYEWASRAALGCPAASPPHPTWSPSQAPSAPSVVPPVRRLGDVPASNRRCEPKTPAEPTGLASYNGCEQSGVRGRRGRRGSSRWLPSRNDERPSELDQPDVLTRSGVS